MKSILFAAVLAMTPLAAHAYEQTLPKNSLLCGNQQSINEAVQATDRGDVQWLGSLTACFLTNQPLKAQRIACEGRTCQIRFWVPNGQSAVGYTFRTSMAIR